MKADHILFIGFGAPEKQENISEFLRIVTRGIPIPEERLKEVAHHYDAIGGGSPYNRHTFALVEAIKKQLAERKISLPVFIGMRNWNPFLKDTLAEIKAKGFKKGIGIILAPHRSDASWEKYIRNVEDAKKEASAEVDYAYLPAWHEHPGFIQAQADRIRSVIASPVGAKQSTSPEIASALSGTPPRNDNEIHFLFTAHSIPVEMAQKSNYVEEIRKSSELVACAVNHSHWSIAYQSRSGSPRQPWLEPDVNSVIQKLATEGVQTVLLVPIGFLCDNAEVLYDLDIEAKAVAEKSGIHYLRVSTVMDHPKFAAMFSDLVGNSLK